MNIQERVDQLNKFIADQNYRVEQWTGEPKVIIPLATEDKDWVERYTRMHSEFHKARRLTKRITWIEHDKCWWIQGKGYTDLTHVLDTEIKVYAVTEIDWNHSNDQ